MSGATKVVIAGAGPVGMVGAYRLAKAGLDVTVLESGSDLSVDSKASTLHPPTLELLDELGVIDEVLDRGLKAPVFQHRDRQEGVLAELDLADLADLTAYPYRIQLEQSKLTRIIRPHLEALPNATLLFDQHVDRAEQRPRGGAVFVNGSDEAIEGDWVIGCDGANSMVRQSFHGWDFPGETYPERFLVMSTLHDFAAEIPGLAHVAYITDPDEWVVLLRTPDQWRCLMAVSADEPNEAATAPERIEQRLQSVAPIDGEYDLVQYSIYNVNQRVAPSFAHGRVLIAGDSAHMNNPLGGMGMNSGVHDVWSAVDTILAVEDGVDADTATEIYGRIRSEACHQYIQAQTKQNFRDISAKDPGERKLRNDHMRHLMVDAAARREYLIKASMLTSARTAIAQVNSELAGLATTGRR